MDNQQRAANLELKDLGPSQQQANSRNAYATHGRSPGIRSDEPEVVIIDNSAPRNDNQPVIDSYNLVYIILLIHGVGTLMPWNMFINASDYFRNYKLNSTNIDSSLIADPDYKQQLVSLQGYFLSYLGVVAQVPNVLFNGLNLLVNFGSGNLKLRVNLTLIIELIIFAITTTLALVDSSKWPIAFFYITMLSVVVLNMASGIYQNCIFGTGAIFPTGAYINAILIGSNFSGTFTASVNLLSIWLAPKPQEAATYYFVTALFVILLCLVSYNLLPLNPFFNYYERKAQQPATNPDIMPVPTLELGPPATKSHETNEDNSFKAELNKKWLVFKKCWVQCLNVFLTFFVTLSLFPAVLADIDKSGENFSKKYFAAFASFFIFNAFAMLGNLLPALTTWPGKDKVWLVVVARFLFIPFFLLCNFKPATRHWPVLFASDWTYIVGNIFFAATSGYLSSICMMFASSDLPPEEARKAGMLAAFFLVFGIFMGVNTSFLLTWLVELG